MTQLHFASQAYQARSQQLISQQCINAFTEPTPAEGKTTAPVYGIAGLSLFSRMGNGPIYGMHIMANNLYVLSGNQLWEITANSVANVALGTPIVPTLIGTTTIDEMVSMADNARQLVMTDGDMGWIYQPGGLNQVTTATANAGDTYISANIIGTITSGDTLIVALDNGTIFTTTAAITVSYLSSYIVLSAPLPSQVTTGGIIIDSAVNLARITAPAFMGSSTVRYLDGYFVFEAKGTRSFFLSAINDGTQYSGLDFAIASAGSDDVVAVEVYHEQLLIMCKYHIEIWWDAGTSNFPFQRYDAALIARGLAAPYAVCSEDNTIFWLGDDGIMYRLNGYAPERISTFAMEFAWAQYPQKYLDCSMFVLNQEGHKFIIVNFPSGNATWTYDIASQLWHQRESWGTAWV